MVFSLPAASAARFNDELKRLEKRIDRQYKERRNKMAYTGRSSGNWGPSRILRKTQNPRRLPIPLTLAKKERRNMTIDSGRSVPTWLKGLKKLNINPNNLSFKELGAFRDLDRFLNEPIPGPFSWQYLTRSFRYLTAFALTNIIQNEIEPLSRCWTHLNRNFISSGIFDDGVFVESWIFCDFPCKNEKKTILDLFEEFVKKSDAEEYFQCFIKAMQNSRLGIYQETISSKTIIKFTELISGRTVEVFRCIEEFSKGEIFLTRIVQIEGESFCFGDPKCWPKEHKNALESMVKNKLFYFDGQTIEKQFEKFMKYSGPYWMSCAVPDEAFPIFPPDYYLTYFQKENRKTK